MISPPRFLALTVGLLTLASASAADNVTGQVISYLGNPVSNANIDAIDEMTGDEVDVVNGGTNSSGFFDATLPGPGVYTLIFRPPVNSLWQETLTGVVVVGSTDVGVVVLEQGAALSGRVLRPDGTPFADLDLDLVDASTGVDYDVSGDRTDSLGNFTINAPLGPVELQFEPNPGDIPLIAPDKRDLDLSGDTNIGDVQLENGFIVVFQIDRTNGTPVVGADIDAMEVATGDDRHTPGDNTDSSGAVDIVIPAGDYIFEVCPKVSDKLVSTLIPATVNANTALGVTLENGWYISGNVIDPQGAPVAKADLDVFDEATSLEIPLCGERSDEYGYYVAVVPSGTFTVVFEGPEGSSLCPTVETGVVVNGDVTLDASLQDCTGSATVYCDTNPNNVADIAIGTFDSGSPNIDLDLTSGPPNQFVYLLVGNGDSVVSQPPGAKGDLCVVGGSCLGRYDKDIGQINTAGAFSVDIQNPISNPCQGGVVLSPGSTWNFQFWHRQPMGAPATFSKALKVVFQ